ncbi:serine protein kinase RIO [Candidatus Woesearchaeota archaeon]|nr:serine protein kinase RIO [Candidatus Woesearchaeota archaeon]
MAKISKEKWKVWGNVFDEFTFRTLFKLASQGHFEKLKSPISIGKESNIFSAKKENETIIIKIYRLETCDFNRMYDYIKYDPRYVNVKTKKRKIVFAWTQREFRNLLKAREAGVNVPRPITFLNNILCLEFIGDKEAAPKLKDKIPKNKKLFFEKIIKNVQKLYKADLIHADLSQFNILNFREEPVFIDFSQCTLTRNPRAEEFLKRDIKNICNFFNKIGLNINEEKVLKKIKNGI